MVSDTKKERKTNLTRGHGDRIGEVTRRTRKETADRETEWNIVLLLLIAPRNDGHVLVGSPSSSAIGTYSSHEVALCRNSAHPANFRHPPPPTLSVVFQGPRPVRA